MTAIQISTYISLIILVIGLFYKVIYYATMPVHVRWELYPVPHEKKERVEYGGSYMEEVDCWTKPKEVSLFNELKEMLLEILLIKSLYTNNKKLWNFSFPFHLGLYFLVSFVCLLCLSAILQIFGVSINALNYLTIFCGAFGLIAGTIGALGLLLKRTFNEDLKKYSSPSDYFNLLLLLAIFISGLYAWLTVDNSFSIVRDYIQNIFTFKPMIVDNAIITELVLACVFFIYLPFTHMTHFIAKYFTYHSVRWGDEPMKGSNMEPKILEVFNYKVTWSAPHIKTGLRWSAVVTDQNVEKPCWMIKNCDEGTRNNCKAFKNKAYPCWELSETACEKDKNCNGCEFYRCNYAH